ncbi:MAG: F0F1 ATP synthase subunit alpha [Candidatus Comchoanobacterales bacterium]
MSHNTLNADEITRLIHEKMNNTEFDKSVTNVGYVSSISDGVAYVYGLSGVMSGEMVSFGEGLMGLAMNLEEDCVGVSLLGDSSHVEEGHLVSCTHKVLEVPIGPELAGRVVDALGQPVDGQGPINAQHFGLVEHQAPGVITRQSVDEPLKTGIKSIDAMTPIGKGQRELIIGDRQTGKTAIAIDTIINQKDQGIHCIYVAVGQKSSTVMKVVEQLKAKGAMAYTTIVMATAAESATKQFIAPFAGCAMGEYYRDRGEDALIVYDDLSKHAVAYRQLSLLLRRPPGREAFPGDIFYLHSRLLERSARVNEAYVQKQTNGSVIGKTGSLTALPIIETQAGDVSAFVPTNVISITDGQIFLETDLFNSGQRPAMNVGLSVSRVGGAAQPKHVKKISGNIKLNLAQYRELAAFAQFGSDLDSSTQQTLARGQRLTELMKQAQYAPISSELMVISFYAAENGYLDDISPKSVLKFEHELHAFIKAHHQTWLESFKRDATISPEHLSTMEDILQSFKHQFVSD